MMLYRDRSGASSPIPAATAPAPLIGRFLAHTKAPAYRRAFLAADLFFGEACLVKPTLKQAAAAARVNILYARAAAEIIRHRPDLRVAIEHGERQLLATATETWRSLGEILNENWLAATAADRADFIRRAGHEQVFNVIEQVLD
jgi:hypothetical protein